MYASTGSTGDASMRAKEATATAVSRIANWVARPNTARRRTAHGPDENAVPSRRVEAWADLSTASANP